MRAQPLLTVKQYASHAPYSCIEYATADDGIPAELFGFDVKAGTSFDRALEIVQYMSENLEDFAVTE